MIQLVAAYTAGLAFGFAGALELGRRAKRARKVDEDSDKVIRFLNGFLAAATGAPKEGDWSNEWRDGWDWFHDVRNQAYAEATQRTVH